MTGRRKTAPGAGRFVWLFVLLAAMLLGVAARLVWVQTVEAGSLAAKAEKQRVRELVLTPRRGSIFDREGEPLAKTVDARTIYAVPHAVKDATGTAAVLAGILGGDQAGYLKQLQRSSSFSYIARKVDLDRASAVERLGIEGIGFLEDSRRTYPSGELACQVLGFVGVDDNGLSGLEKYYDDVLTGQPGRVLAERDPYGRPIPGGVMESVDPVDGRSITLTIDKDIQYEAHVELAEAVARFGAKGGSITVMDPRSGEIYAMASWPNYDPNSYAQADPRAFRNTVVTDAYEPGSTVKSFTAAAVIDRGLAEPATMFHLPSTLKVGDRTIHESHDRGAVTWSLTDIVTKSSNVGAVKLGQALGKNDVYDYFRVFGLTERTGVDYPGEAKGWLPPPSQWSASSIGNVPFGQGISMTVLQLTRAYAALANGGKLVTPHFLVRASGVTTEPVWPVRQAIPAATTATMRDMLRAVVNDGTGASAAVPSYDVAGKTGTAQKPRIGGGGYIAGAYISSFAGFLPAVDPRIVIVVIIDEPTKGIYGGTVAAPSFSRVAEFSVAHLKILPVVAPAATAAGNGAVSNPPAAGAKADPVLESSSSVR
ncbi:MAG: penicillin-binding protein 2 [Coriobacteriia bacterium]|nr:penicillin-binding protein 2 [Coriobacteriia bacterium]